MSSLISPFLLGTVTRSTWGSCLGESLSPQRTQGAAEPSAPHAHPARLSAPTAPALHRHLSRAPERRRGCRPPGCGPGRLVGIPTPPAEQAAKGRWFLRLHSSGGVSSAESQRRLWGSSKDSPAAGNQQSQPWRGRMKGHPKPCCSLSRYTSGKASGLFITFPALLRGQYSPCRWERWWSSVPISQQRKALCECPRTSRFQTRSSRTKQTP